MIRNQECGFILLEVMVSIAIIAIALTAVLSSQSQSLSLAGEARFNTTSALLAQNKMAEIEAEKPEEMTSDSGDFGEDFPNYRWDLQVSDVSLPETEGLSDLLKRFDLNVSWGDDERYIYRVRLYRFVPKTE